MKFAAVAATLALVVGTARADERRPPHIFTDENVIYHSLLSIPAGTPISFDIVGLEHECPSGEQESALFEMPDARFKVCESTEIK